MADQIVNRGTKGRAFLWFFIMLILFIMLVVYIYNQNFTYIQSTYTG